MKTLPQSIWFLQISLGSWQYSCVHGTLLAANPQGKTSSQSSCYSTTKNQQLSPAYPDCYTGYCDLQSM